MKFTELTRAEDQIMQVIWSLKECCLGDIVAAIEEPRPAYTTISTVVRTLETKGFVTHKTYGKTHSYFPIVEKSRYSQKLTTNIVKRFLTTHPRRCYRPLPTVPSYQPSNAKN